MPLPFSLPSFPAFAQADAARLWPQQDRRSALEYGSALPEDRRAFAAAKDDHFTYKYSQELLTELEGLVTQVDRAIRRFGERMAMAIEAC